MARPATSHQVSPGAGAATPRWFDASARQTLHRTLIAGDALALLVGFVLPLMWVVDTGPRTLLVGTGEAMLIVAAGLWCVRFQGLWWERVTSVRMVEVSRITRALAVLAVLALVFDRKSSMSIRAEDVAIAAVVAWSALVAWRAAYRSYVAAEHRHGRLISRVVIVGTDRRAAELQRLFEVHPELGMRVVAVIGSRTDAVRHGIGNLWAGETVDAHRVVDSIDAEIVVLSSADLEPTLVHALTAEVRTKGRTVYVDPGLSRVDFRRMQATAVAHQPLLQLEPSDLSNLQLLSKRVFDVAVSAIIAVIALPVMALAALAIKLDDGGPIFFRQIRVGRNGEEFGILKFRTMCVDAEARLAALQRDNERKGPLFKMDRDPRITRVGRFLRATSLDELPQVFNVLGGTMSVVGPRPALPAEVVEFPAELHARHRVRPGITGLWQVEARDNPSFDAYRRLDLFYVENWSLALDLVILLATADHIVLRPLVKWLYRGESRATDASVDSGPAGESSSDSVASIEPMAGPAPLDRASLSAHPVASSSLAS